MRGIEFYVESVYSSTLCYIIIYCSSLLRLAFFSFFLCMQRVFFFQLSLTSTFHQVYAAYCCFMFLGLAVHGVSWICGFLVVIKFGKILAIISSDAFSLPLYHSSLLEALIKCLLDCLKFSPSPLMLCSCFQSSIPDTCWVVSTAMSSCFTDLSFCNIWSVLCPLVIIHLQYCSFYI